MNKNLLNKKSGFTFVELVVSIVLSSIIFIFLMKFISDTFEEMSYSNNKTKIITQIYEFEDVIGEIREKYNSGYILVDNETGTGSDILLFRTGSGETKKEGYIFAMISNDFLTIDGNNNVDNIGDKVFAYKKISSDEFDLLSTNLNNIYNFQFNRDKVFSDIKLKDFQVESYNTGAIFEAKFFINPMYKQSLDGQKFSEIGTDKIEEIVFNF